MFKSLASFFVIVVLLVGCKSKTEECVAPAIDKNLVGTWKAVVIEDSEESGTGTLTFNADGTINDPGNLFLGSPVTKSTWKVIGGDVETTFATSGTSVSSVSFTFKVKENTCTKIVLDVFGLYTVELTK
ncbi:hypothetical protein [Runella sp. SP2]|uniref:hypothetical protein n=1 Tax=Runella sp. SP2 TaxID=2268026 RepID=UPI000F07D410|nr:hypothetical protein [Runella sp. SP2]AYQ32951.1 hypothetical protein DTQ70_12665 [Runella sp. SP2]